MADVINMKKKGEINGTKFVIIAIIALIVIIVVANCFTVVKPGHSGVVVTLGSVNQTVLAEGLHVKIPFITQVVQVDNRVLKTEVAAVSASKDLQNVYSTIAINYRVNTAASATLYQNVGLDYDNIIVKPAIQECVKAVSANFTAEELITNRQMISSQMEAAIAEKINPFGLSIEVFNIINFEFSEEFNKAIEEKQTAQQNALKAEQDLARIKIEAEQTIEQAKAEAEAYRLKNEQITDKVILMEFISKWDGKMPQVVSDMSTMFDISSMIDIKDDTTTTYTPAE